MPPSKSKTKAASVSLLVGTMKGAFILRGGKNRSGWKIEGPIMLGSVVDHLVRDPRDGKTLLMGSRTGHMGPTVYRSTDGGKTWKEASKPPAFPKSKDPKKMKAVKAVFWLTPGHASQPGTWYAGTVPFGLFRTTDGGDKWEPVKGFNDSVDVIKWTAGGEPPDGPFTHSILVDPRDAKHLYIGLSIGGVCESTDAGKSWKPLNRGSLATYMPDPDPEYGQDPHNMVMNAADPDRLYQQNHCGIFRLDRADGRWQHIGANMPKEIGDIGFPVLSHPRDRDKVWVFPMDGTSVWPRTSPQGKPAVYMSSNGGKSWKRCDKGFPREHAYYTVFRTAAATDTRDPVGLYLGMTCGEVWASGDEGASWSCIASHLPRITSVEVIEDP